MPSDLDIRRAARQKDGYVGRPVVLARIFQRVLGRIRPRDGRLLINFSCAVVLR